MQKSLRFIVCFAALLLTSFAMQAQAPQKFSYQAVVRNASNALVRNTPVGVRISIFQYTAGGTLKFQETHTPTTNDNGLFTVEIGGGTPGSGNIAIIDWGDGPYFLRSEVDFNNDATYDLTADQQLLAVPYALHCNEYQDLADIVTKGNHAGMKQLKDVQDPTQPQDAVTKHYLDSVVAIVSALSGARVKDTAATKCVSFLWPRNGRTYTSSGLYLDTIENACGAGCDTVVALRLTIVDGPAVTLGEISSSLGTSTCAGSPATLTANVTASTGVLSYAWTRTAGATLTADNTASVTTNNLESGSNTYSVTVTATVAGCGTTNASKNITISGTTASAVTLNDIAGTSAICLGGNTTLTASPSASTGTVSYAWSASPSGTAGMSATTGAAITATPTATGTHRYTVTATAHQDGCADANDSKWIDVSVEAAPAVALGTLTSSGGTSICVGQSTNLALSAVTSEGNVSYVWTASPSEHSGLTTANADHIDGVTPDAAGTYTYTVTATASKVGCSDANDSKSVTVSVNALPTLVLGNIKSNDVSQTIDGLTTPTHTLAANVTTPTPLPGSGISYQWYKNGSPLDGQTNSTLAITTGGVYKVRVTYNNGTCSTYQEKEITICETPTKPEIELTSGSATICSGNSASLKVSDATYNGAYAYTWKRGSDSLTTTAAGGDQSSISANAAGSYTVRAKNTTPGCTTYDRTSDGFTITVETPAVSLNNIKANGAANTSFNIDKDESLTLAANVASHTGGLTYKWSTVSAGGTDAGTDVSSITPSTATAGTTTYHLRVIATTASGCKDTADKSISVTVVDAPSCDYSGITQQGAIQGLFSVSSTKQVMFSKGNLQYKASTGEFRFADNQYTALKNGGGNITSQVYNMHSSSSATTKSSSYSSATISSQSGRNNNTNYIDLFASGTDGVSSTVYYPWENSRGTGGTGYTGYIPSNGHYRNVTTKGSGDWGWNNQISNGGSSNHVWRVLEFSEWDYLISSRPNASSLYGYGKIGSVYGIIILPDCWALPAGCSFTGGGHSDVNIYTTGQWTNMENNGAVFLPATGYVSTSSPSETSGSPCKKGDWNYTWTLKCTFYSSNCACYYFTGGKIIDVNVESTTVAAPTTYAAAYIYNLRAVRLVKDN